MPEILPLKIKPAEGGLKIVDRSGRAIAWFYTDEDPRRQSSAGLIDPEEARRFAQICARALTGALDAD
jgi:hypothetical protein